MRNVLLALTVTMMVSGSGHASLAVLDSGFDDGLTITSTQGNNDNWVDKTEWSVSNQWMTSDLEYDDSDNAEVILYSTTGGSGDNGAYVGIHANYADRGVFQVVHDQKATTGSWDLSLDVKTFNANNATVDGDSTMTVEVVGMPDNWGGAARIDPPFYSGETVLKTWSIDVTSIYDWQTVTTSVDFGTGYDYVVIDIQSGGHDGWNDSAPAVGIDNVTVVPEPATMALLALGGAAMLRRRRR